MHLEPFENLNWLRKRALCELIIRFFLERRTINQKFTRKADLNSELNRENKKSVDSDLSGMNENLCTNVEYRTNEERCR